MDLSLAMSTSYSYSVMTVSGAALHSAICKVDHAFTEMGGRLDEDLTTTFDSVEETLNLLEEALYDYLTLYAVAFRAPMPQGMLSRVKNIQDYLSSKREDLKELRELRTRG